MLVSQEYDRKTFEELGMGVVLTPFRSKREIYHGTLGAGKTLVMEGERAWNV
ncbi:hypothetical protein J32TS6_41060 [Virgibacillus pantothenticus]|uniref:hypothetical protein n=1 Tax=Virgibacillus TaxID=84406 RepID=UPI000A721F65|nr:MULTISPECIES: hypothetical protein [Virgibacillus]MBS7427790.1 hypothetical protein [Virgibacillus sp. 19R1-5]MBU8568607.1 hypothetical protein [Virgibacillus pantothenticus]MBU8644459.1 hypothetical protein [Virgibacillus pantothenticus]MBU8648590.1 hypothetical protein [Virgibacillus pantothenticus]MBU8662400.1 hypothetical protein [Virgibacillus pantothenticus]